MSAANSIVVCGGGPSGLTAAIFAARAGAKVVLLERMARPGLRLSATGGGHCNFSNMMPADRFMEAFGKHGRFMDPALEAMNREGLREFLAAMGQPSECADGFHLYPVSGSAGAVRDALVAECSGLTVDIRTGCEAVGLEIGGGKVAGVASSAGTIKADAVILASGGLSRPELGGSSSGYDLARTAGHSIVQPAPALVPLVARETWPGKLAGVSLSNCGIEASPRDRGRIRGEGAVLFTHRGVSGPAVLDISGAITRAVADGSEVSLAINPLPDMHIEKWLDRFDGWRKDRGAKSVARLLAEYLPGSLAGVVLELAGIAPDARMSGLNRISVRKAAGLLCALPLTITGSEGFENAMVTSGGVNLREINPKTLESRLVSGLYFSGEITDLAGPCGGFNLQWAFSSGCLAGIRSSLERRSASL